MNLSYEDWKKRFSPIMDEQEGREKHFHWKGVQNAEMDAILKELEPDKNEQYRHVWTLQTDDGGELCLTNGYHFVNRLEYIVCKNKWEPKDDIYCVL